MLDRERANPPPVATDRPLLLVVVDTEEEFDWGRPLARENTAVSAIKAQHRAHRIFDRYGLKPTYVIDYSVASQPDGYGPLKEIFDDGRCQIGAHLHPWVNPPHDETVTNFNSYPGNLPPALERAKLAALGDTIGERFGAPPTIYKAGRYGVGPATTETLEALGYEIDASVVPCTDFTPDEGPDFRGLPAAPYWFGVRRRILELPCTTGLAGLLSGSGQGLYDAAMTPAGRALKLGGIYARLRLMERIRLSPEGIDHAAHRRLTRSMLRAGHKVFSMTYHSPSLEPGHTPYVRTETELGGFLDRIERYCDWFFGELGGAPATPADIARLVPDADR